MDINVEKDSNCHETEDKSNCSADVCYKRKRTRGQKRDICNKNDYFPIVRGALPKGNICRDVAVRNKEKSSTTDVDVGNNKVTNSEIEDDKSSIDPKRPRLRYKRTRKHRVTYTEGDSIKQSSFGVGFSW